jgi:hypothetical protein
MLVKNEKISRFAEVFRSRKIMWREEEDCEKKDGLVSLNVLLCKMIDVHEEYSISP